MTHKEIRTPKVYKSTSPFSHATVTTSPRAMFITGQVAQGPDGKNVGKGDITVQTVQAFENMKALVEEAGGTMADVCRLRIYLRRATISRRSGCAPPLPERSLSGDHRDPDRRPRRPRLAYRDRGRRSARLAPVGPHGFKLCTSARPVCEALWRAGISARGAASAARAVRPAGQARSI